MPIYAYKCESCGFAKDVLQKMSDAPLENCPNCAKPSFKKQLTAAGFQLKGSGWYATDFKGGGASAPRAVQRALIQARVLPLLPSLPRPPRRTPLRPRLLRLQPQTPESSLTASGSVVPFKKYLLTGLMVWLPLAITIWVLLQLIGALDSVLGGLLSGLAAVTPASMAPGWSNCAIFQAWAC